MRSAHVWAGAGTAILIALCATSLRGRTTVGTISVMVRAGSGTPVGAAKITVVGTQIGAMTSNVGKAIIHAVPPGLRTLRVSESGGCQKQRDVNVPDGGSIAITIWLCPTTDVATVDGPDDQIEALLDVRVPSGGGGSTCENDLLHVGTGFVTIDENAMGLVSGGSTCPGAVMIFSADRAISFMNTGTALPWTDAVGDEYDVTRPPHPIRVPVTFWMLTTHDKPALITKILSAHVGRTKLIWDESKTGLMLVDKEGSDAPPIVNDADTVAGASAVIGDGCAFASKIRASTNGLYDPARLNVYYVENIESGATGGANGYTCTAQGGQNIIFINRNVAPDHTLTHEIAHALGLDRPTSGHTDPLDGFYADADDVPLNVMNTYADSPTYFSLGQSARMNFSAESWLNMSNGAGTSVRSRQAAELGAMPTLDCGCPESDARQSCPALNRDIVRSSNPIPGVTAMRVCTVTAPESITVPCGSTANVTANYFQGTTAVDGTSLWTTFDPSIATVSLLSTAFATSTATITGVNVGTTAVRANSSGPYAQIQVTVTGTCPPTP